MILISKNKELCHDNASVDLITLTHLLYLYFSEVNDRLSKLKTRTIKFEVLLNDINKDSDKV